MEKENNTQEYDMNVRPELGKWASFKQKAKLKKIRIKEAINSKKEKRTQTKQKQTEMKANGQTTRKEVAVASAWAVVQGAITLGGLILAATTALPLIGFLAGVVTTVSTAATIINVKDAKDKYKKYRKENPKTKKEKAKTEKKKKDKKKKELKLGKGIKKFFSKFKKKSEDSDEAVVEETPELTVPTPTEDISNKTNEKSVIEPATYKLEQNNPEVVSVDLSNINIQPGLNIVPYHFVVRKDDEVMKEIIEQYIEKTTGCPAMYADRVIDNEEKRVYILNK